MPNPTSRTESLDIALARRLLQEQAPDLADLRLGSETQGWDNTVFRLGDTMALRIPHREEAVPLIEVEQRWLPVLAGYLSVQVPAPVFAGRPSDALGRPWSVVPWFPGRPASELPASVRARSVEALAEFFTELHVLAPSDAPENDFRGLAVNRPEFDARFREEVRGRSDADALLERWDAWRTAPDWDGADVWVHGDTHPSNIILSPTGGLNAVVDWGDLTAGDPASDLAAAWMMFDAEPREHFISRYTQATGCDDATWTRAKAWALRLAVLLAASERSDDALRSVSDETLARLVAEPA